MRTGTDRPLLAVCYDLGAAGAAEILSAARPLCDVVFLCDRTSRYIAERIAGLAEYARVCDVTGLPAGGAAAAVAALGPAGIVTFSEAQLARTAELAAACGLPFHQPATVARLTDKFAQRAALRRAGVDTTGCRPVDSAAEVAGALAEVGLPAVLKPRRGGAASRDTYLVHRVADAVALVAAAEAARPAGPAGAAEAAGATGPAGAAGAAGGEGAGADGGAGPDRAGFVVEELLTGDPTQAGEFWGDRVSVESLVCAGTVHTVNVTGKFALAEPFRETGQFSPSTLDPDLLAEVTGLAAAAVAALGVRHGATHTEIKLTAAGPRVIEVNGRLGGNLGELLRRSAGYDILRATMEVALGGEPALPRPGRRRLAYQRYLAPPRRLTRLLALDGLDRVRALPGVQRVEPHAWAGKDLDWRRGTEEALAVVYGTAADHGELRSAVRAIDAAFTPVFA